MNGAPTGNSSRVQKLGEPAEAGILDERILLLLFEYMRWDIPTLCRTSAVNRKLQAVAKRLLWRELCRRRAPRMTSVLTESGRMTGGWDALGKLLFFCGGSEFRPGQATPGHFAESTRFSKTSGRSFLAKSCGGDVLYVSDPCEHRVRSAAEADDVGVYRGVFGGFMKSRTRQCLIRRRVELEAVLRCPYCGARVWSMTSARLIARRSAARRLGSRDDELEYFVCLNGHLHGTCWLAALSSDDGGGVSDDRIDGEEDDGSQQSGDDDNDVHATGKHH
ncbi:EID1-like F-box protein 3 [Andrographis paniculata]|uniref:EID1-like F-box protein 3 n=1 Tax=Andrographis paniculata TaxID=175694 RepID=UPI0021E8B7B2|nr:EID1-like F-box protein 3 [Andrographis paniculata]